MAPNLTLVSQGNAALDFTHFLLLSRVYSMDNDDAANVGFAEVESTKSKKAKREAAAAAAGSAPGVPTTGTFYYHPEEEFLENVGRDVLVAVRFAYYELIHPTGRLTLPHLPVQDAATAQ